jgi:DNA-binding winged helix-turn-helix (wHTH) protein
MKVAPFDESGFRRPPREAAVTTSFGGRHALSRENSPPRRANPSLRPAADAMLEFGRFRVLLRQRQLIADGLPTQLGTRAFDLLMVLLESNGSLVTKDELVRHVWPGIVVSGENLKVQISALRKVLGEDRDFIRTEFGRGYRFTAAVISTVAWNARERTPRRCYRASQMFIPHCTSRRRFHD